MFLVFSGSFPTKFCMGFISMCCNLGGGGVRVSCVFLFFFREGGGVVDRRPHLLWYGAVVRTVRDIR